MTDYELIAALIFLIFLMFFIHKSRSKLDIKEAVKNLVYFVMYRTSVGLKMMDSWSKRFRKFFIFVGYLGIFIGFLGMILIGFELIKNIFLLFTKPAEIAPVGLVLPIKGRNIFYVPFSYWIISIFVIATVHEFAHGLIARAHNMKVKSSGLAFIGSSLKGLGIIFIVYNIYKKLVNAESFMDILSFSFSNNFDRYLFIGLILLLLSLYRNLLTPIIPAAFVEPDEKELKKRPYKQQLSVFAAGPFANIITALFFLFLTIFVFSPIVVPIVEPTGVKIVDFIDSNQTFEIKNSGVKPGDIILKIDNKNTLFIPNLSDSISDKKPGDPIKMTTNKGTYSFKLGSNPENKSMPYFGIQLDQTFRVKPNIEEKYGSFLPKLMLWLFGNPYSYDYVKAAGLVGFIIWLNLGIGLFNLVPIGPLDGGRMLQLPLHKVFGKERGNKIWMYIGFFFVALILINLFAGFFRT